MKPNQIIKIFVLLTVVIVFTSCGTFEVGIENNVLPGTEEAAPSATEQSPSVEDLVVESTIPAPTAIPGDEQQIAAALVEKIGQPLDQLSYAVTEINGDFATGGISNGYFLAARQGDAWVIVYDGQATPPCLDVENYRFPIDMVPECMDDNNQVAVRSASPDADIRDALAAYTGVPLEDIDFTIMQDAGEHLMGYSSGGYFLAKEYGRSSRISCTKCTMPRSEEQGFVAERLLLASLTVSTGFGVFSRVRP